MEPPACMDSINMHETAQQQEVCPVMDSDVFTLNECRRPIRRTSGFLWAQLQLGDDLQAFKLAILIQGHCHKPQKRPEWKPSTEHSWTMFVLHLVLAKETCFPKGPKVWFDFVSSPLQILHGWAPYVGLHSATKQETAGSRRLGIKETEPNIVNPSPTHLNPVTR
jgi:hypothetical protein